MKYFPVLISLLLLLGCYDTPVTGNTDDGAAIVWKGVLPTAPATPEENWVYYDTELKKSLIFNGYVWDTMTIKGVDGVSLKWMGSQQTEPVGVATNTVYFNQLDKISYIFNGKTWDTLSCSGESGLSIQWKGNLDSAPSNPQLNWLYFNTTTNEQLIFNGVEWVSFLVSGVDGLSINWQGTHKEHPQNPQINWAYYNSIKMCSYIFEDIGWSILSKDGPTGEDGSSIVWLGEMNTPPNGALLNWAYLSSVDGNSYIFDGSDWKLFAVKGKDGISISWQGTHDKEPENPLLNWAYYNRLDGNSYIFNGKTWDILCKGGNNGVDGISITWLGVFDEHPKNAPKNALYYNYIKGKTYIYSSNWWQIFSEDGKSGNDGVDGNDGEDGEDSKNKSVSKSTYVNNNDTLTLYFDFGNDHALFSAHYVNPLDSCIYPWDAIQPHWTKSYLSDFDKHLNTSQDTNFTKNLFKRNDGSLLYVFSDPQSFYKGGTYSTLSNDGEFSNSSSFAEGAISSISVQENSNNNLLFTYVRDEMDSTVVVTTIIGTGGKNTEVINTEGSIIQTYTALNNKDELFVIQKHADSSFFYQTYMPDGTVSDKHSLPLDCDSLSILALNNGKVLILGESYIPVSLLITADSIEQTNILNDLNSTYSFAKPMQLANGDIFVPITCKSSSGNQYVHNDLVLVKLSQDGLFLSKKQCSSNASEISSLLLHSGNILLFHKYYRHMGIYAYFCRELDQEFNELTAVNLLPDNYPEFNRSVTNIETILTSEDDILATYQPHNEDVNIRIHKVVKQDKIDIQLKEIEGAALLINNSGERLHMTLTAYRR